MLANSLILLSLIGAVLGFVLSGSIGLAVGCCFAAFAGGLLLFLLTVAVTGMGVDKTKPVERVSDFARHCCEGVGSLMNTFALVRPTVSGLEILPKEQRFLLVANHCAATDPAVMIQALKGYDVSFISKPSNMEIPLIGRIAHKSGYLAIDRENDRNALKTILAAANYMKKDFCSICIFPEGTRSRDGVLQPFHAGSFKIAQRAGAPVVIACLVGTEKVKHNLRRLRISRVRLDLLEVLDAETVVGMSTNQLAEYSRDRIQKHLEQYRKGE